MLRSTSALRRSAFRCLSSSRLIFTSSILSAGPTKIVTAPSSSAVAKQESSNLRTVKKELIDAVSEDVKDLSVSPDSGLTDYIKEAKLKIIPDPLSSEVVIKKTVENYEITVKFDTVVDEQQEEDEQGMEDEEGREDEDQEQEESNEEEGEDSKMPVHSFEVDVYNTSKAADSKTNYMHISAYTDANGQLCVESMMFDESLAPLNTPNKVAETNPLESIMDMGIKERQSETQKLFFDDLSEQSQDKLLQLLESMGIDDRFGQFIQHYSQLIRTQAYMNKLVSFRGFLDSK